MIAFLRRYRRALFIATITIFLLGTFVGLGGYLFTSRDMTEAVAAVGSTKIPYSRFISRANNYLEAKRNRDGDLPEAAVKEIKVDMLRGMIVDELLLVKAEELGIIVTDDDLARDIRSAPAFQVGGEFSPEAYYRAVRTVFHETPQGYEEMRRREIKVGRLKQLVFQSAKLSPEELSELYARENKGSMKNFAKDKDAFAARAQQLRALELINFSLRQLAARVEIRTFLEQREPGI